MADWRGLERHREGQLENWGVECQERTLLGFATNSPQFPHDRLECIRPGAQSLSCPLLPVLQPDGLLLATSIVMGDDNGLNAREQFEEEARGDVGRWLVAVVGQPGVGGF